MTHLKLQVPKINYVNQVKRKSSISKLNAAFSITNLPPLYYEIWHVRNPDIFRINGMLKTLEYSKARLYLDLSRTYSKVFAK